MCVYDGVFGQGCEACDGCSERYSSNCSGTGPNSRFENVGRKLDNTIFLFCFDE